MFCQSVQKFREFKQEINYFYLGFESDSPDLESTRTDLFFLPNPPTCESKKSFSTPLRIRKAFSFFEYFKDGLNFQCLFDFRNRLVKGACFGAAGLSHIRTSATALRPDKWGYFLD